MRSDTKEKLGYYTDIVHVTRLMPQFRHIYANFYANSLCHGQHLIKQVQIDDNRRIGHLSPQSILVYSHQRSG